MKNIKLDYLTIYFLLISFFCGFIKTTLIILGIIFIHEMGHVFFCKIFKYTINSITLYPFGGVTVVSKDLNTPINKDLLIALGGVIFQLFIYLVTFLDLSLLTKEIIFKYNTIIILFNLIPIIPLDGSIILNLLLNKFFSFKISYKINFIISFITVILFITYNTIYSLNNYLIILFLLFKMYQYKLDEKYMFNRFLLERYLNNYQFLYLNTRRGNLDILKKDTYQYFLEHNKVVSEKDKLKKLFDNKA